MFRAFLSAMTLSLCVALVTPTLASTTSASAPAARGGSRGADARLDAPEQTVATRVPFDLSGRVSTKRVKRPVQLQLKLRRGTWRTVSATTTDRRGRFTFEDVRLRAARTTRLRALLPAMTTRVPQVAGGPRELRIVPATRTKALLVDVRRPRGRLTELPALSQRGADPAPPRNDSVVSASFDPPLPGRKVVLERLEEGLWLPQASQREDAAGFAVFNVPAGHTYRAVAGPFDGARPVSTGTTRTRVRPLLFEDTFDSPTLDPRWSDFVLGRGYPDSGRTCALTHPSAHSTGGGVLQLGIAYDPTMAGRECRYETAEGTKSSPYLYQSQLATWRSFRFTHGIAAARIKFARARGRHSGFWVQVGNKVAGDPATGTEIDVVEFFGESQKDEPRIGSFLHYVGVDGASIKLGGLFETMEDLKPPRDTWWDSFHVFSVTWTPSEYVFRVDGREFYREHRAISSTPQWLVLSAIPSDYELEGVTPDTIDDRTQVDWVRVWTL